MNGSNRCLSYRDALLWNSKQGSSCLSPLYDQPIRNTIELLNSNFILAKGSAPLQGIHEEIFRLTVQQLLLLIHCYLETCRPETAPPQPSTGYGQAESCATKKIIYKVMRTIESDYRREVSLKKLSARAHLNSSYLVRLYREQTGSTPLKYLHELRMSAAKCYLAETEMTVQEIADATGYHSIHYFSRLFKQRFHLTPTEWRKQEMVANGNGQR
jgi:AraC-like DNA-binding protein